MEVRGIKRNMARKKPGDTLFARRGGGGKGRSGKGRRKEGVAGGGGVVYEGEGGGGAMGGSQWGTKRYTSHKPDLAAKRPPLDRISNLKKESRGRGEKTAQ